MKKLVLSLMKKLEMRLKETWLFQILELLIYRMDDLIAPVIIEKYKEQVTKRMKDVGCMNIVTGYVISMFQDFESYLRTEVDLIEDNVRLVLDEYNSSFITYEISPGKYTFKDISEAFLHSST